MPTQDEVHRAREARRLMSEPLLAEALTEIRMEAAREVLDTDPSPENADKIRRHQALARACEEIVVMLQRMITRGSIPDVDETS